MYDYPLLSAKYDDVDGIPQLMNGKSAMQVIDGFGLSSFYRDDHIAFSDSGSLGRSARINPDYLDAVRILHVVKPGQTAIKLYCKASRQCSSIIYSCFSVSSDQIRNNHGKKVRQAIVDNAGVVWSLLIFPIFMLLLGAN